MVADNSTQALPPGPHPRRRGRHLGPVSPPHPGRGCRASILPLPPQPPLPILGIGRAMGRTAGPFQVPTTPCAVPLHIPNAYALKGTSLTPTVITSPPTF